MSAPPDSSAGCSGPFGKISGHYLIAENGKTIAAGTRCSGAQIGPSGEFHTQVTLSPRPATIRFVLDAARKAKIYTLSTSSQTVWTWRSAREGGRHAPGRVDLRPDPGADRHRWRPVLCGGADDDAGVRGGGAVAGRVGAGGCPGGAGHRGAFAVGQGGGGDGCAGGGVVRWREELAPGGGDRLGGSYTASFTAPAGVKVSLRTSAADAAGGTITETLINAYQVAS